MCVVSNAFDTWEPLIPHPTQPDPLSPWWPSRPWKTLPAQQEPLTPNELRALLRLFGVTVDAARQADAITGQPDCEDPEKAKLKERVDELTKRLDRLEAEKAEAAKTDPPTDAPTDRPIGPTLTSLPSVGTTIKYDPNTWCWHTHGASLSATCATTYLPLTLNGA